MCRASTVQAGLGLRFVSLIRRFQDHKFGKVAKPVVNMGVAGEQYK